MEAVLAVEDIDYDFDPSQVTDISQLSAEEFLLYVRYEAEQCPGVVRAKLDSAQFEGCQTEYMPRVVDIPTCHEMFLPSSEWANEVIDTFSRFRQHLSLMSNDITTRERKYHVPSMKDESAWFSFCLGGNLADADGSAELEEINKAKILGEIEDDIEHRKNVLLASLIDIDKENNKEETDNKSSCEEREKENEVVQEVEYAVSVQPSNQLLLQFDQVLTQRLLGFFMSWLQFPCMKIWNCNEEEKDVEEGEISCSILCVDQLYSWIFSLLSRLEKPLYMDASATVREIYRQLCIQRVELAEIAMPQINCNITNSVGPSKRTRGDVSGDASNDISQLSPKIRKSLAVLNTVIVICGKYFGQEEEVSCQESPVSQRKNINDNVTRNNSSSIQDRHEKTNDTASDCNDDEKQRKEDIKRYFAEMSAKYPTLVRDEDLYKCLNTKTGFSTWSTELTEPLIRGFSMQMPIEEDTSLHLDRNANDYKLDGFEDY